MADAVSSYSPAALHTHSTSSLVAEPTSSGSAILGLATALIAIGIVMAFSTGATLEPPKDPQPWWNTLAARQAAFSIGGLFVMLIVSRFDYRFWCGDPDSLIQPALFLFIIALGLTAAVLVPGIGVSRNGARRWLNLGSLLSFQPSEVCKPALVLFLAAYVSKRGERMQNFFSGLVPALLIIGMCVGLVGVEDFGTAALLIVVGGAMLWCSSARKGHLLMLAIPAMAAMAFLITMKSYRMQRITGFLHYDQDPQGKGYHAMQSLIAIASGGWWGQGLGAGIQKFGYLPEARSDFIFAVICEELGIIGGIGVIGLFVALVWQGWRTARHSRDDFGRLLAIGGTLILGVQAMINVGVVTVSFPTKGIALPFVSAGGTGVVFLAVLAGILASVGRHGRRFIRESRP